MNQPKINKIYTNIETFVEEVTLLCKENFINITTFDSKYIKNEDGSDVLPKRYNYIEYKYVKLKLDYIIYYP